MKKLLVFNMISLDGFFEGTRQEIDWHVADEEFNQFAEEQLKTVDTLLFGRTTYLLMAGYWPTQNAHEEDPEIARLMNDTAKIVFSKTLESAAWQNTRLVRGDAAEEIGKLRQLTGGEMMIFGSGQLVSSLARAGLIDEYRLMVNPVILGSGNSLFSGLKERLHLKLEQARTFKSGNVLLSYRHEKGKMK